MEKKIEKIVNHAAFYGNLHKEEIFSHRFREVIRISSSHNRMC